MEIKATNIKWETDGENVELPSSLIVNVYPDDEEDTEEIEELISNAISDATGFLHNGFEWLRGFDVPVFYQMYGTIKVFTDSKENAAEIVQGDEIGLPENASYVEGSFGIDETFFDD